MTTPTERMRSLRWAWEFLDEIQRDLSVEATHRADAARLAAHFPEPGAWLTALQGDDTEFPSSAALLLDRARTLFRDVQRQGSGTEQTRRTVLFILRHFPEPGSMWFEAQPNRIQLLREWIAAEDGAPTGRAET